LIFEDTGKHPEGEFMDSSPAYNFRKNIAGISFMIAPFLLLTGDLLSGVQGASYAQYVVAKVGYSTFFAVILGLMHLLREQADRTGIIGGGMAMIGCMSGVVIVTGNLLNNGVSGLDEAARQTLNPVWQSFKFAMVMIPLPGLFFPIGLLVLSVGLWRTGIMARWQTALLGLAAILFPLARIPSIVAIAITSDILFILSLGLMGWKILKWTAGDWQQVRRFDEQSVATKSKILMAG
jgi:hypothetical protein